MIGTKQEVLDRDPIIPAPEIELVIKIDEDPKTKHKNTIYTKVVRKYDHDAEVLDLRTQVDEFKEKLQEWVYSEDATDLARSVISYAESFGIGFE